MLSFLQGPLHCRPGRANRDRVLSGLYGHVAGPRVAIAARRTGDLIRGQKALFDMEAGSVFFFPGGTGAIPMKFPFFLTCCLLTKRFLIRNVFQKWARSSWGKKYAGGQDARFGRIAHRILPLSEVGKHNIICEVLNEVYKEWRLSDSQRAGLITLLFNGKGSCDNLANYVTPHFTDERGL